MQVNTDAVRAATIRPMYGAMAAAPCEDAVTENPTGFELTASQPAHKLLPCSQCGRNASCDKPYGHPGFCSGPRAAPLSGIAPKVRRRSRSTSSAPHAQRQARRASHDAGFGSEGGSDDERGSSPATAPRTAPQHARARRAESLTPWADLAVTPNPTAPRATRAALVDAARRSAAAAGAGECGRATTEAAPELEAATLPAGTRLECALSAHDLQSGQVCQILWGSST